MPFNTNADLCDHNFVFSPWEPLQMILVKENDAPVNSDISEKWAWTFRFCTKKIRHAHTHTLTRSHMDTHTPTCTHKSTLRKRLFSVVCILGLKNVFWRFSCDWIGNKVSQCRRGSFVSSDCFSWGFMSGDVSLYNYYCFLLLLKGKNRKQGFGGNGGGTDTGSRFKPRGKKLW